MANITPNEALVWLAGTDQPMGDAMGTILAAKNGMEQYPPGSAAHTAHSNTMDASLTRVEAGMAAEAAEGANVDPKFATPACDCVPGEPCCLRAFEVADNSKKSRKIAWPVPTGQPKTLFVITKDPYNSQPSAEVEVKLTDYEICKNSRPQMPAMSVNSEFANAPPHFAPNLTAVSTVTSPFHLPAALSALMPEEVLVAIYVAGFYLLHSSYRSDGLPKIWPDMCSMMEGSGAITVHPVPHVSLETQITGTVSLGFNTVTGGKLVVALEGSVKGEVANQVIEYTGKRELKNADRSPSRSGPVKNPFLDTIAKIHEKVVWMANNDAPGVLPKDGLRNPMGSSITMTLTKQLTLAKLELKGKDASPDLELTVDPMNFRISLNVTGKMDLVDMLIQRVPMLADAIRDAREILGRDGNPLTLDIRCDLTLEAEGGVEMGVDNGAVITIGSQPEWEKAFDNIAVRFQCDAKILGKLEVSAQVGVDTWLFDGAAGAEASVSTGWHFGIQTTRNQSTGETTRATRYYFEGLRVKGKYYVRTGGVTTNEDSVSFDTFNPDTTAGQTNSTSLKNETTLLSGEFDENFFDSEGSRNGWDPV